MYWITSNIKDNGHNNHNYSKQLSHLVVLVMTVPNQREGGARSEDFFVTSRLVLHLNHDSWDVLFNRIQFKRSVNMASQSL